MTSTGEALKNQTCCWVQDFPTFKPRNQQVKLYFLLEWGFVWATHNPYKAYPNNQETFFTAQMVWWCWWWCLSAKLREKREQFVFFQQLNPNAPWNWHIYQHFAIKITYFNVGKYIPIPWILLGNNASFQSCTHTWHICAPIWDADLR